METLLTIVAGLVGLVVIGGYLVGKALNYGYQSKGKTLTFPWTWTDSDLSPHVPQGTSFFIEFNAGRWMRPVLKPWYWFRVNPWFEATADNLWFVIDIPFAGVFFGAETGGGKDDGWYAGAKRLPLEDERYRAWTDAPLGPGLSAITWSVRG